MTNSIVFLIAMTANARAKDREVCIQAGMNDDLSKPVSLGEIKNAIQRYEKSRA